jgi:hypothetical protein
MPSQSCQPGAQPALTHWPLLPHAPVSWRGANAFVQSVHEGPQCAPSSACSQPVAIWVSQSSQPALHVMWHVLDTQDAVAFCDGHTVVHPPQCVALLVVFTHAPLQFVSPLWQPLAHLACEQTSAVFVQSFVQLPQWVGSPMSVSQPFAGSPSQSSTPGAQVATLQAPAAHVNATTFEPLHASHIPARQP